MENKNKIWLGAVGVIVLVLFLVFSCGDNRNQEYNSDNTQVEINTESSLESSHTPNYVYLKYKGNVDVNHPNFEYLNTSKSSWVRGAWYDIKTIT